MLSSVKNIERDVQDRTDKGRELNSAIDADKKLFERWLVLQSGVSIYTAVIRPRMEYACAVWSGGPTGCPQRLQDSFAKRHSLSLPPLEKRFEYHTLVLFYREMFFEFGKEFVGVKLSFPGNHATLTVLSSNNFSDHNNNYRTTSACAVWKLR